MPSHRNPATTTSAPATTGGANGASTIPSGAGAHTAPRMGAARDEEWSFTHPILGVVRWRDALIDEIGFAFDDPYVEMFWLPVLGPTATWLLRRLASGLVENPDGYEVDARDLARALGVSHSGGRASPFARALHRCAMFGVAQRLPRESGTTVAVRLAVPVVAQRHLERLPPQLRAAHRHWAVPRV